MPHFSGLRRRTYLVPAALFLAAWMGARRAEGQVDSNLLRQEWQPEDHWVDSYDKPFFIFRAGVRHRADTIEVFHWDSTGRFKPDRTEADPQVWGGYQIKTVGVFSSFDPIDHGFYDIGLAAAGKLGSIAPGWTVEVSGGVGSSNDGAFSNRTAIYPTATAVSVHEFAPKKSLELGLTYNGNCALAPGVPVPVAEVEARLDPSLSVRAGFPHLEAEYTPFAWLSLWVIGEYPADARFRAEVALGSGLALGVEAARQIDPFHLRDAGHERIFYRLNTGELGLHFRSAWIDVSFSGGWAFGQEFFTGYDLRDRSYLAGPDGGVFAALTFQGTF